MEPGSQKADGIVYPEVVVERRLCMVRRVIIIILLLASIASHYAWKSGRFLEPQPPSTGPTQSADAGRSSEFLFSSIKPSECIQWHPCYDKFQCARLSVPLDWKNASEKRTAAIAMLKLPAKVPVTSPNYGGPIILNPGGPGGSGVFTALNKGAMLQAIVDAGADPKNASPSDMYFDIVGFDPRGVNNTTPVLSCFPNQGMRDDFDIQTRAIGWAVDDYSFRAAYNRITAVAQTCSEVTGQQGEYTSDAGRFVTTAQVVEDIMEMNERMSEWREKEAKTIVRGSSCLKSMQALERTTWNRGKEMVQYMGFSYGTVLGATLASMHPDRMKRIMIDGVCDADDYYSTRWLKNLQDADMVITRFFELCYEAGPDKCAIYSAKGPDGSKAIYEQALSALRHAPISVKGGGSLAPDVITYTDLKAKIKDAVYQPSKVFGPLAQAISEVSVGNGTTLAISKQGDNIPYRPRSDCRKDGPWSDACVDEGFMWRDEISAAIYCSDGPDVTSNDEGYYYEYWKETRQQSATIGEYWAELPMHCANWAIRPAWRFEGEDKQKAGANTSHPMLLTSNTYDPVTPLANARKMSTRFGGSVVIEQRDVGHCALATPGLCLARHVRRYFQTGELPEADAVCETERKHFDGPVDFRPEQHQVVDDAGHSDRGLAEAVGQMSMLDRDSRFPLGF